MHWNHKIKSLTEIKRQLTEAPPDFVYPKTLPDLEILIAKPELIREELEETRTEEVKRLREAHDGPARLGNFQPLMEKAVRIFDPPKNSTQDLAGQIQTVENAIAGYRRMLLENPKLGDSFSGISALKLAKRKIQVEEVTLASLEKQESLKKCVQFIEECLANWKKEGDKLLKETAVSFDRWSHVVGVIKSGAKLDLEPKEADALVNNGFLRRSYSLEGGSL